MLRQVTSRSAADTVALHGAWALLDTRLTDSIRVLALEVNQPTERRLFFLRLLTRYAAPNAAVDDRGVNAEAPSVLLAAHDPGGVVGTNPPTADSRNYARATILTMGSSRSGPNTSKAGRLGVRRTAVLHAAVGPFK